MIITFLNQQISVHHHIILFLAHQPTCKNSFSASELFFFLVQYSFLFSNNDTDTKTCTLKTIHFLYPQGNGENGARYLDPKYSRWISTDPALGEYVPLAPVNDDAKKHNENLPGMGGLFNTVNLSLYHYAGTNPVKYVDPDGNDIEETSIISFSGGALGAIRISAGIAIDSNGTVAFYGKLEFGVGAGASIGLSNLFSGTSKKIFNIIDDIITVLFSSLVGKKIADDILTPPEDTGTGTIDSIFDVKWETYKDWNTAPVEGAFVFGVQQEKNGDYAIDGPALIASVYLSSLTFYLKICDTCDIECLIEDATNRIKKIFQLI